MKIILETNPAMNYEHLGTGAFNCSRAKDPWGYANADWYSSLLDSEGKRALSTILIKLVIDNTKNKFADKFISLENKVWKAKTRKQINTIINEAIKLYNETEK